MARNSTSFKKGQGGRQKGTPNKTTKQIKSLVVSFIGENWEQMQKDFKSRRLHPRDRLSFFEKLLKYTVPVLGSFNASMELKKHLETLAEGDLEKLAQIIIEHQNQNEIEDDLISKD